MFFFSKWKFRNHDFSVLIVSCAFKKSVFQFLGRHVTTWFAKVLGKKYRLIPAGAEDGQNRQKPLETTIFQFQSSPVSLKK